MNIPEGAQYNLYSISSTDNRTYVYGNVFEENGLKLTYYIFEKYNNNWKMLDSFVTDNTNSTLKWGYSRLYTSSDEKLYTIGGGLWERTNSGWRSLISYNMDFKGFSEKGENNMIIAGSYSEQYHFNGIDWERLKLHHDGDIHFTGVLIYNDSATIIGWLIDKYPEKTVVFRGE